MGDYTSDEVPGFGTGDTDMYRREVPLVASTSKMLQKLGLTHNPYVDRTAEKSELGPGAFYLPSDLQGFRPSETTYIFFGRRGSGKSQLCMMMMQRYREHNEKLVAQGKGTIFIVDLRRPGHLNDCLKQYMASIGADRDNWDAQFADNWSSNDLADCIVSFAINDMMRRVVSGTREGKMIVDSLSNNPRSATQFLLLAHLYTREDSATLRALRAKLLPIAFSSLSLLKTGLTIGALAGVLAGTALAVRNYQEGQQQQQQQSGNSSSTTPHHILGEGLLEYIPSISKSQLTGVGLGIGAVIFGMAKMKRNRTLEQARAKEICKPVRIARPRVDLMETLLNSLFSSDDTADRIRGLHIGHAAQQKLELIDQLTKACGFQGLAVFGDCFDEVGLLDPLLYPGALKIFAREVCKNEVLNQGSFHFFFPDARASLDLSTDRVVREARFDRHFVRDLTWSRFQLEDLAERRFNAAQEEAVAAGMRHTAKFQDLFEHVSKEDFSGAISKLQTPRELMVFMTELLARVESHAEDGAMVTAPDMEIAVQKAKEQSV